MKTIRLILATMLVVQAICLPALAGQADMSGLIGKPVRVTSEESSKPTIGTLLRVSADTLVVQSASNERITFALEQIQKLDVKKSEVGRHAIPGLLIGAVVGALWGAILYTRSSEGHIYHQQDMIPWMATTVGLLGGAVGLAMDGPKWRPVPLGTLTVTVAPNRKRPQLIASISF